MRSFPLFFSLPLAFALPLAFGCVVEAERVAEPHSSGADTGTVENAAVLRDEDNGAVEASLEVEELEVAAGVDVLLDWSGLHEDLWGRPLAPLEDAQRASLYHFVLDDPTEILEGLVHDSLPQCVLDLHVRCQSKTASCLLSEFTFYSGHSVDVVEQFQEADGTWLLAVESNDGAEELAFLVLVPVDSSTVGLAELTDGSSAQHLDVDLEQLPVVEVRRDGAMMVDWSELRTDLLGDELDPRVVDRLAVARVPHDALDDPERVMTQLRAVALELWLAEIPNSASSFPLVELQESNTGEQGFAGPEGQDPWLLLLGCSSCGDPLPRFVSKLAWAEGQSAQEP